MLGGNAPLMTNASTTENHESILCPKCSSPRVRDMRRVPVLMGIWFGCLAGVAVLPPVRSTIPDAQVWVVLTSCLPVAILARWIFCRVVGRRARQYECRDCHNRWKDAA